MSSRHGGRRPGGFWLLLSDWTDLLTNARRIVPYGGATVGHARYRRITSLALRSGARPLPLARCRYSAQLGVGDGAAHGQHLVEVGPRVVLACDQQGRGGDAGEVGLGPGRGDGDVGLDLSDQLAPAAGVVVRVVVAGLGGRRGLAAGWHALDDTTDAANELAEHGGASVPAIRPSMRGDVATLARTRGEWNRRIAI